MMKRYIFLGLILIAGCSQKPSNNQTSTNEETTKNATSSIENSDCKTLDFAKTENIEDTTLFYLVDRMCAITVMPDTSWLKAQQNSMSEDSWNTIVDDHNYYESLATDTLKLKGINTFYKRDDRKYITFKKGDNSLYTIDRNKMKDVWGLILFNGNDNPVLWKGLFINGAMKDIYRK